MKKYVVIFFSLIMVLAWVFVVRKNPKVSVIVPVYNAELYLSRCLDSLLAQSLKDIEIIAVDDGSTDKSLDILKEYAQKDQRIKVYHKENGGIGSARNLGLAMARGEFIGYVDNDDYVSDNFYEELYNTAKKYRVNVAATYAVIEENLEGTQSEDKSAVTGFVKRDGVQNSEASFRRMLVGWQWNKIYKHKFLSKENVKSTLYNTSAEDVYFTALCLMKTTDVAVTGKAVYHRIYLDSSVSHTVVKYPTDDLFLMYKDLDQRVLMLNDKREVWHNLVKNVRIRDIIRTRDTLGTEEGKKKLLELWLKYFPNDFERQ